ncbi:TetR/AcrR family transcriptional regulator [Robertmurraya korlensis]|uniref:TetR/AcrR family transcriptional regulator n=1 Tax=Robertmurraya korlensis TaxID=519977 RepID=UPI000826DFE9|nr:TetR/AcrR family transcriptional regulator [Robertmurraya korlensis]
MKIKKEHTKEIILKTATRLFQTQGYNGTGINQIIEESGTPKGSLYYHFPKGKEEIALEAIHLMKKLVLEAAGKDLDSADDVVKAFQQHVKNIALFFDTQDRMEGLKIGLLAAETANTHETLRLACESTFKEWQNLYAEKLEQSGYKTTKAQELAVTINALLEGAITISLTNKSGDTLRIIANQIPALLNQKHH